MEKIHIRGLKIFAYHGVNPEEKQNGQNFVLDVTLQADLRQAMATDALEHTVNYAAVRKCITAAFTAQSYDLIERAAAVVAEAVLQQFAAVQKIRVLLKKPEAPMNAVFDYVAVEIEKER